MKTKIGSIGAILACAVMLFSACDQQTCVWQLNTPPSTEIHTTLQSEYLTSANYRNVTAFADGYAEKSLPNAISLTWSAQPQNTEGSITEYVLELSTSKNFKNALSYRTTDTAYDVYNLQIATDYYWRVTAVMSNGETYTSAASLLQTDDIAPRNLLIDGVTNVRDLGGWETPDGRIKQGVIIRGGRLNKSGTQQVQIEVTEKGKAAMLNELNIRSEIDLRCPIAHNYEVGGITESPLGDDVIYYNVPLDWNVSNLLTGNKQAVVDFFEVLGDEDNYPVYFHCNIGTDRTGLFAYLINGLLGVSEEDLYRDYLFSNFGKINSTRTLNGIETTYIATIKAAQGANLSEKIENYLLSIGVPAVSLDVIRYMMSE